MSPVGAVALLIEAGGGAVLAGHVALAAAALLRGGPHRARLLLADGAVLALSLKTGATLLRTLELGSWDAIGRFLAILALRTVLKQAFARERAGLLRSG